MAVDGLGRSTSPTRQPPRSATSTDGQSSPRSPAPAIAYSSERWRPGDGRVAPNSRGPSRSTMTAGSWSTSRTAAPPRPRRIDGSMGSSTFAGSGGVRASLGDGGPASSALLSRAAPRSWSTRDGTRAMADALHASDPKGVRTASISTGMSGFSGDVHRRALWTRPCGVVVDADGHADHRRQPGTSGCGGSTGGDARDGGSSWAPAAHDGSSATVATATAAADHAPMSRSMATGALYVVDYYDNRVRRLDLDGVITTVAGNGTAGICRRRRPGHRGRALVSDLDLAIDSDGRLLHRRQRELRASASVTLDDGRSRRLPHRHAGRRRRRWASDGNASLAVPVAGGGRRQAGTCVHRRHRQPSDPRGDDDGDHLDHGRHWRGRRAAVMAVPRWRRPGSAARRHRRSTARAVVYIADASQPQASARSVLDGIITTIAGTGTPGLQRATAGRRRRRTLDGPWSVAPMPTVSVWSPIPTTTACASIAPDGTISTVGGTGRPGTGWRCRFRARGRTAHVPKRRRPRWRRALLIARLERRRVRRVSPDGQLIDHHRWLVHAEGMGPLSAAKLATPVAIDRGPDDFDAAWPAARGATRTTARDRRPWRAFATRCVRQTSAAWRSTVAPAHGRIYLSETSGAAGCTW
jgi:hypothetical protein